MTEKEESSVSSNAAFFESLNLNSEVARGLQNQPLPILTPPQQEALSLSLEGKILMIMADPCPERTAVFAIRALELVMADNLEHLRVIIMTSRQNSVLSIARMLRDIGQSITDLEIGTFVGGNNVNDIYDCMISQIAVGTAARIKQLVRMEEFPKQGVQLLILDEVERMLKTGSEVFEVMAATSSRKQLILCASSLPLNYLKTFKKAFPDINRIEFKPAVEVPYESVRHFVYLADASVNKKVGVAEVSEKLQGRKLVFANFNSAAKSFWSFIRRDDENKICVDLICSQMSRELRVNIVEEFQRRENSILVTTDWALQDVFQEDGVVVKSAVVVNVGVPNPPNIYSNRVRFLNEGGTVVTVVVEGDEFKLFQNYLKSVIPKSISLDILRDNFTLDAEKEKESIECHPDPNAILDDCDEEAVKTWTEVASATNKLEGKKKKKKKKNKNSNKLTLTQKQKIRLKLKDEDDSFIPEGSSFAVGDLGISFEVTENPEANLSEGKKLSKRPDRKLIISMNKMMEENPAFVNEALATLRLMVDMDPASVPFLYK